MQIFLLQKGLLSEEMFRFLDVNEIQGENESITEKAVSDGTEISKSINDTET